MASSSSAARIAVASLAFATLPTVAAQERPQPADLTAVSRAFAVRAFESPFVAVAVTQGNEPLVLCGGRAADGVEVAPSTLLPLGAAARLLVADAASAMPGIEPTKVAVTVADRQLTVAMLLAGSALVPDYYSWRRSEPVRADELLRCVEVAVVADQFFRTTSDGVGELVLLEQVLLGGKRDWPTALRTALAPHAGLDPLDAAALPVTGPALAVDQDRVESIARAEPAVLRLCLPATSIADWWQWRVARPQPLPAGPRAGFVGSVPGHASEPRYQFRSASPSFHWSVFAYPTCKAALVIYETSVAHGRPPTPHAGELVTAFETALFGEAEAEQPGLGGRFRRAPRPIALAGTAWVARDGSAHRLEFAERGAVLRVVLDGRAEEDWTLLPVGDHYMASSPVPPAMALLAHRQVPSEQLWCAFVATDAAASIPRRLDFVRSGK